MIKAETGVLGADDRTASAARVAVAAAAFALALAAAAQIRIPLPFTPVPITLQTLVLYLGASWLGTRAALPGLALYVGVALIGAPVLSGWRGGLAAFTGATGGYILGWAAAVVILSRLLDGRRVGWHRAAASMALVSAVLLGFGALHLGLLLELSLWQTFLMGVAPFLPGDALKILAASALVRRWPNPIGLR